MPNKIITVDSCTRCPFGIRNRYERQGYIRYKCAKQARKVLGDVLGSDDTTQFLEIPADCPLQDLQDYLRNS